MIEEFQLIEAERRGCRPKSEKDKAVVERSELVEIAGQVGQGKLGRLEGFDEPGLGPGGQWIQFWRWRWICVGRRRSGERFRRVCTGALFDFDAVVDGQALEHLSESGGAVDRGAKARSRISNAKVQLLGMLGKKT